MDFDAFVLGPCMQAFGETVAYTPQKGAALTVTGVFDAAFMPLLPLAGGFGREPLEYGQFGETASTGPALGVQLSQFLTPPGQGDMLTVRGVSYQVREIRPDGVGGAMLMLNEAG